MGADGSMAHGTFVALDYPGMVYYGQQSYDQPRGVIHIQRPHTYTSLCHSTYSYVADLTYPR